MHFTGTVLRMLFAFGIGVATTAPSRAAAATSQVTSSTNGEACLRELARRGVDFVPLRHSVGVRVPVRIEGEIGDVLYRPTTPLPLVVDCRFGLVLSEIAPILRRNGVRVIEFSNSHAYRNTHWGKLSLHANGLAIDLHRVMLEDGAELSVQDDFSRRLGSRGCWDTAPTLNRLACDLRATGVFSELLTPDYNGEHRDHFHLGIPRTPAGAARLREKPPSQPRR